MKPGKSRTRLLIVLGVGAAVVAAMGGTYAFRRWQIDRDALAKREAGKAALAAGDNEAALDGIGTYILRFGEQKATSEDYALYAKARQAVPLPQDEHLYGAISALKKASDLDPASRTVQEDLLALYMRTKSWSEAAPVVKRLLEETPGDTRLLRTQADVFEGLRQYPEAIAAARALAQRPDAGQADVFRVLRLLVRGGTPVAEIELWLDATIAARPDDPLTEQFRGIAQFVKRYPSFAKELIERTVVEGASPEDPEMQTLLVRALDGTQRFGESLALLREIKDPKAPAFRRELVRRLWFAGDAPGALERAEAWSPDAGAADPEVLAIRALALASLGRGPEAKPLRDELAARKDPAGRAWASLLDLSRPEGPLPASVTSKVLTDAVAAVPDSALLLGALGDAKAASGELDAAIRAWTAAAHRAPSWSHPFVRLSRAYATLDRSALSLEAARAAVGRSPSNLEAMAAWIDASADSVSSMGPPARAALQENLTSAAARMPELANRILPLRLTLLLSTDKAAAVTLIEATLESPAGISEDALLRIAAAAQNAGIATAERTLAVSERLHGVTPRLALTAAVIDRRRSAGKGGLATFDAFRARAADGGAGAEWEVARATLLDGSRAAEAGAAWAAVADANPASLPVQLAALGSASLWDDRAAVARTIDRMKALTGEDAVTWKISRARLVLEAEGATGKDVAEVAELLAGALRDAPENVSVHMYLADAKTKLGDAAAAEEHVRTAYRLAPQNGWILLRLAEIENARGDEEGARQKVDALLTSPTVLRRQKQGAAHLLAAQGDLARSADLLQRLLRDAPSDRGGTLMLSGIYAKLGRTADAIRLGERLLDEPTAEVVEHMAGLYASSGRTADADALVARLDAMALPPGDAELVRARHAARWGAPGAAIPYFRAAVDAAPARTDVWTGYVTHAITAGDAKALAVALDDPRGASIDAVAYLRSVRELCDFALPDPGLRLLLVAAIDDPAARPAIADALRRISRDWSDPARREEVANSVRSLAEANPKVFVLRLVAVDLVAQTSSPHAAVEFAWKTAETFPNSAHAARQWAQLLAQSGNWTDALPAAREWRTRTDPTDTAANELVARALLRLARTTEAVKTLEPLVPAALARPAGRESLILTCAVALVRSSKTDRAEQILRPLAEQSERWRALPLEVAPDWLGAGGTALAWLELCESLVPKDDAKLQLRLAQAWTAAWKAYRTPELLAGANRVLARVVAVPGSAARAHAMLGSIAHASGELDKARASFETALKLAPEAHDARNNFALALADAGRWEEAVAQATQVTRALPNSADALDTLAYAYRKGKQHDEAAARLRQAMRLEPWNPAWPLALAETMSEKGDATGVATALVQVRKLETDGVVLTPPLKARVEKLAPK